MNSSNLITYYIEHIQFNKRLSPRTITVYKQQLTYLLNFCNEITIDYLQINNHHIRRLIADAYSKGKSTRSTIALQLSSWRGFYKWLVDHGYLSYNPCLNIKPFKTKKYLPKALSIEAALALIQSTYPSITVDKIIKDDDQVQQTIKILLISELLYGCGLRVSELVNLDLTATPETIVNQHGWIDLTSQEVHIFGKGGKKRMIPLGKKIITTLNQYLINRGKIKILENALLLNSKNKKRITRQEIWYLLKKQSLKLGLNIKVHPHMLRHSFASHILQSSGDLISVQELLGHQSIVSTQVYTRLNFQHLARIYDVYHPRAKLKLAGK